MRMAGVIAWLAGCAACVPVAWAGKPHEHGVARLDVAVEAGRVDLNLEISLDDLAGFERAPRTDAEKATVAAVVARLRAAAELFNIDGAAACTPVKTELLAGAWQLGHAAAPDKDGHADLEARYQFNCSGKARPGFIEVGLFEALPRLKRVDVQAVTAKGQMKVVLRRPQGRLALAR